MKKRKKLLWIVSILLLSLVALMGLILGPYALRVQQLVADPAQGYHADFFLYVSPGARDRAADGEQVVLLIQPNNSGTNSDDPATHVNDAWWTGFGRHGLADELEVALLVPAFLRPAQDWRIYTHALDRDVLTTERQDLARLDLQLLAMVERAEAELAAEGLAMDPELLLQGFSASGMFANRFTALHPDRVKAVATGSPGGWPIAPLAQWEGELLPYPVGVGDLELLTGHAFDLASYREVAQLIVMGSLDDNDSVDFRDGWDEEPAQQVDRLFGEDPLSRWEISQELHRSAEANASFKLVKGVGHDRRELQWLSTGFFSEVLER